jgi:hypothetical protein
VHYKQSSAQQKKKENLQNIANQKENTYLQVQNNRNTLSFKKQLQLHTRMALKVMSDIHHLDGKELTHLKFII